MTQSLADKRKDWEWERVMGRKVNTAARVDLGLTIRKDGMTVRLDVSPDRKLDSRLIARILGHGKVPKVRRQQPVKFASLYAATGTWPPKEAQRVVYEAEMRKVVAA